MVKELTQDSVCREKTGWKYADHRDTQGGLDRDIYLARRAGTARYWVWLLGSVFDNRPGDYLQPTSGHRPRMVGRAST
jgi:hypothetical protein